MTFKGDVDFENPAKRRELLLYRVERLAYISVLE
jgi:hypothetical protein